jgi:hypothetical protein
MVMFTKVSHRRRQAQEWRRQHTGGWSAPR